MGTFYAHIDPVDLEERAARAAADKESLSKQTGQRNSVPLEHGSRLDIAAVAIEEEVYQGRMESSLILRARDQALGILQQAINRHQLAEDVALQVYREACQLELEKFLDAPTNAAARCRAFVRAIVPKPHDALTWTWQGAIERGLGRGSVPRGLSWLAIDTLGECVLVEGDEIVDFEARHQIFHIEGVGGKMRQVKLSSLKEFKPRSVVMDAAGIERWDRHFVLKR